MRDTFPVPRKFKGEATILKIFTKKSLLYTLIGGILGFLAYTILATFVHMFVGIGVCIIIIAMFFAFGKIKIPIDKFNSGGDDLDKIVYRWIKKRKKIIYIDKNSFIDNED